MSANGLKNDGIDKCVHIKIISSLFICILVICWSSIETLMIKMLLNVCYKASGMKIIGVSKAILVIRIRRTP